MQILIIGGTRFMGPHVVRRLAAAGHHVTVFHRGPGTGPAAAAGEILGEKERLHDFAPAFRRLAPEVVVHMMAFTKQDALDFVRVFGGLSRRAVVASSMDVYRAFGRLHGTEPGPPDAVPLTEDSPLRERASIHGEKSEKRAVEKVVTGQAGLPATILRLPAVYGPGDYQHRFRNYLRRMDDGRPAILMEDRHAAWRFSHGYVENVAAAIALAVTDERAAGRIYNVGEQAVPTEAQRVRALGAAAGWRGELAIKPHDGLPPHLRENIDWRQEWFMDTARIRQELGFAEQIGPEEAYRRTIAWERVQPREADNSLQSEYAAEDAVLRAQVDS